MKSQLRILLALEDGTPRTISGICAHPWAPHRSTVHHTVNALAASGDLLASTAGSWTTYMLTEAGAETLEQLRRETLSILFPGGVILAIEEDRGRVVFMDGRRVMIGQRTPSAIEVQQATTAEFEADDGPVVSALPAAIPLAAVPETFGGVR